MRRRRRQALKSNISHCVVYTTQPASLIRPYLKSSRRLALTITAWNGVEEDLDGRAPVSSEVNVLRFPRTVISRELAPWPGLSYNKEH